MAEQTFLQPGQIIRPSVTDDSVPHLVRKLFGLEVTSVKELKSYDDKNFLFKDFQNDAIESRSGIWKMDSVPQLSKFIYVVRNEDQHKLICEILQAWKDQVEPALPSLEKGIIHGDCSEQNILVNAEPDDPNHYHVNGIIDFGDVSASSYVFELAITITHMMIEVTQLPPNDAGGYVLAGYLKEKTLSQKEWDILKICVAARFAQCIVMGAYTYEQDPGNEYVLVPAPRGWNVLDNFWKTPEDEIIRKWKSIAHSY